MVERILPKCPQAQSTQATRSFSLSALWSAFWSTKDAVQMKRQACLHDIVVSVEHALYRVLPSLTCTRLVSAIRARRFELHDSEVLDLILILTLTLMGHLSMLQHISRCPDAWCHSFADCAI